MFTSPDFARAALVEMAASPSTRAFVVTEFIVSSFSMLFRESFVSNFVALASLQRYLLYDFQS
jgi:hypothetical protein